MFYAYTVNISGGLKIFAIMVTNGKGNKEFNSHFIFILFLWSERVRKEVLEQSDVPIPLDFRHLTPSQFDIRHPNFLASFCLCKEKIFTGGKV